MTLNCRRDTLRANNNSFNCLACNCQYEAGSEEEPLEGKKAVGEVVKARVHLNKSFWGGNNVCRVITHPGQFSWVPTAGRKEINQQCIEAARHADNFAGPYWASVFYNPETADSRFARGCGWANPRQIGNHVFRTCDMSGRVPNRAAGRARGQNR